MHRRALLKAVGAGGIATVAFPNSATARGNELVRSVRENGYYVMNNAGSRAPEAVMEHFYRAKRPLRDDTNEGGVVQSRPHAGGVRIETRLTADDVYGMAGFVPGDYPLDEIDAIELETAGDPVSMALRIEDGSPPDDEFFAWESVTGRRERLVGLDGDVLAPAGTVGSGAVTIDRDGPRFGGKTIAEWQREFDDGTRAQLSVGVEGNTSKAATVTLFAVRSSEPR